MALFDDTNDSRTERPTERRRRQAREEGMVARSTELLVAARALSIWIVLSWWFLSFAKLASSWLQTAFNNAGETTQPAAALSQLREQSWRIVVTTSWPLAIAISAILLTHILQVGWHWHWNHLAPQTSRLSPLSGLQRLFSSATAGRALTILLKLTIVTGVSTLCLAQFSPITSSSLHTDFPGQFTRLSSSAMHMVSQVAFSLLLFGVLDYGWQRWRFERSLLMTREEVREELKEVEGDPRLKNQRRALARQHTDSRSANSDLETNTNGSS